MNYFRMSNDFFKNLTKKSCFFRCLKVRGDENMNSAYFDPDAVVFDGFDYTFGIKLTQVCRRSCMKGFYEIFTEFIQLNFLNEIIYPWQIHNQGVNNRSHFCLYYYCINDISFLIYIFCTHNLFLICFNIFDSSDFMVIE